MKARLRLSRYRDGGTSTKGTAPWTSIIAFDSHTRYTLAERKEVETGRAKVLLHVGVEPGHPFRKRSTISGCSPANSASALSSLSAARTSRALNSTVNRLRFPAIRSSPSRLPPPRSVQNPLYYRYDLDHCPRQSQKIQARGVLIGTRRPQPMPKGRKPPAHGRARHGRTSLELFL